MPTVTVARALTAHVATRFVRLATIGVLCIFTLIVVIASALVYFFTPWWWLLLIPAGFLLILCLVIRIVVRFIIRQIHSSQLTQNQSIALDQFVDKIQSLLEARSTPLPIFVIICLKDVLVHRDIRTIKGIIRDSTSLMSDYKKLESLF